MGKVRGVHETTPELRNRMVGMYEAGLGLREIASSINCSQRTVKRWLNRFIKEGNVETKERCGRKRATTQEEDEAIVRLATQTPVTAAKTVIPVLGLKCSVDTIRQRLHKAGIHNWTPSKKYIQKIPLASNTKSINQPVWRPTGTSHGKKRSFKDLKKKKDPNSNRKDESVDNDRNFNDIDTITQNVDLTDVQPSFSFSHLGAIEPVQLNLNNVEFPAVTINNHPEEYPVSLNVIPEQPQSSYSQNHETTNTQQWPLDLHNIHYSQVGGSNLNNQNGTNQNSLLPHLHNQQLSSLSLGTCHNSIQNHNILSHSQSSLEVSEREHIEHSIEHNLSDVQSTIINNYSDVNSNSSFNETSQNSSIDEEPGDNDFSKDSRSKKKGGKIKGTLETSEEIRNRMIGMFEAGLSTLSIALAINRSERTVKRWLDRWQKEGNVKTKERKGRKRITTKEEDEAIIALATQQPLTAAKFVAPALGLKCSVDTVRERLHRAGIHSWKIGKQSGSGNTMHTVHLWQPSGNRSNRSKSSSGKRKKRTAEREDPPDILDKNLNPIDNAEINPEPDSPLLSEPRYSTEEPDVHRDCPEAVELYQEPINLPHHSIMQPQPHYASFNCPPFPSVSQPLQPISSLMPPRPDCRLSFAAVSHMQHQPATSLGYPPCLLGSSNHINQFEQTDPMSFEPYIWSF